MNNAINTAKPNIMAKITNLNDNKHCSHDLVTSTLTYSMITPEHNTIFSTRKFIRQRLHFWHKLTAGVKWFTKELKKKNHTGIYFKDMRVSS